MAGEHWAVNGGEPPSGSLDGLVVTWAPDGAVLGYEQIGGDGLDGLTDIAVDSRGNRLVVRFTTSDLSGEGIAGGTDVLVIKTAAAELP